MISNKSTRKIDLYSIIKDVIRNIWVVILAALTGMMVVTIWSRGIYHPQYTSTATLLVSLRNSSSTYSILSASSDITQIYSNIFQQPTVENLAAEYLGQESFSGKITSSTLRGTNIFTLSVTSDSPEVSYNELRAIIQVSPQVTDIIFSDCVIEVLREPNLPASPSNSISRQYVAPATFGCGLLALALIVIFSYLRDTVKSESIFKDEIDSKLLGTICHEKRHKTFGSWLRGLIKVNKTAPLVDSALTSYAFTEDYHKLASRIEYQHKNDGSSVFLLTSCAENEGKSTVSANIALALALRKNRVALLDVDFKKPAVHKVFEVPESDKSRDLADYLSGKISGDQYRFTRYKKTDLDLGINRVTHFDYVDWIHNQRTHDIITALKNSGRYDYIILDTPPISAAADITVLTSIADSSILVIRTDYVPVGELNDVILSLKDNCRNFSGCILNDVHKEFSSLTQFAADESGQHSSSHGYYGKYSGHSYPGASGNSKS